MSPMLLPLVRAGCQVDPRVEDSGLFDERGGVVVVGLVEEGDGVGVEVGGGVGVVMSGGNVGG